MTEPILRGRRILVVEDDYFIAGDMQDGLSAEGAFVAGPVATVREALELFERERLDGAVLDVNLGEEDSFSVAAALHATGTPFVFVTGYNSGDLPAAWAGIRRLEKPVSAQTVARALFGDGGAD